MTRRRIAFVALSLLLLWGGYRMTVALTWTPGVTQANAEAQAVLGEKAGMICTDESGRIIHLWIDARDNFRSVVVMDRHGLVESACWGGPPGFTQRFRAWLGW